MEKETTISISGLNYKVKKTFRSLILFEELTGRSVYKINDSVNDIITLFYCILKSNNSSFIFTKDEFIDLLDDNENSIISFTDYLQSEVKEEVIKKKKIK